MKPTFPRFMNPNEVILKAAHVSKRIGGKLILDNLNFTVGEGEIFGILGKNGAGKTVLIQTLMGLITPDQGTIQIFGKNVASEKSWIRQRVNSASSFQHLQLQATILDNLLLFARLYGVPRAPERIKKLLKTFNLTEIASEKRKLYHLSSGEHTKAMLCKAFLNNPKILFLDEPTASLDPMTRERVARVIKKLQRERQMTVLYASHNLEEIRSMCTRVLVLRKGAMTYCGPVRSRQALIRKY